MLTQARQLSKSALITYAAVSDELENSNDFLKGIAPLFSPVAFDNVGRPFDAILFREQLRERFGLSIPEDVAAALIPRLRSVGLLEERRATSASTPIYFWTTGSTQPVAPAPLIVERIDRVIAAFSNFSKEFPSLVARQFSPEELEQVLFDFLLSEEREIEYAQKVLSQGPETGSYYVRYASEGQYLAARFLETLKVSDQALFEFVGEIKNAIVVSQVIIELGTKKKVGPRTVDLMVYLDSPFVMDYLGLSGPERKSYALQIVSGLRALNANVAIFDHSVAEIRSNLQAVLSAQPHQRTGPTAQALRTGAVDEAFVKSVMHNPEYSVEQTDIPIAKITLSTLPPRQKGYFSKEDENRLYSLMRGIHRNEKARERDVSSVGIVIARREGYVTNPFRSKHLLATDNSAVSRVSSRFMREEKGAEVLTVPPALHLSRVVAAIWLEVGLQDKLDITSKQLVASCVRALSVNPAIIVKIRHNLRKINPENVEQYEAIISQPRYLQMSMDSVLGQPQYINSETSVEIFDRIRDDIVEEERAKVAADTKKRRQKERRELTDKAKEVEELAAELDKMSSARKKTVEAILSPKLKSLPLKINLVSLFTLAVGVAGLVGSIYLSGATQIFAVAICAVFFCFGLCGLSLKDVRAALAGVAITRMKKQLHALGFEDLLDQLQIDPHAPSLRWQRPPPSFRLTSSEIVDWRIDD
jgi:hypothetical protein